VSAFNQLIEHNCAAGLHDAFIYLQELAAMDCARTEQFTVVANACNESSHVDALELLQELLRGYDRVDIDRVLQNALRGRR
jgi:lactate dehydrogenase-like 2-hydroxyacid dehydrogenase